MTAAAPVIDGRARDPDRVFVSELQPFILGPVLRKIARALMRSPSDADDLIQEVAVRAWRSREKFIPGAPAIPWLSTIARNAALNAKAGEARRLAREADAAREHALQAEAPALRLLGGFEVAVEGESLPMPDPLLLEIAVGSLDADQRGSLAAMVEEAKPTERQAVAGELARAVLAVPTQRRKAMLERARGRSNEEVAKMQRVRAGTIKSRCHRGREDVRRSLAALVRRPRAPQPIQRVRSHRYSRPAWSRAADRGFAPLEPASSWSMRSIDGLFVRAALLALGLLGLTQLLAGCDEGHAAAPAQQTSQVIEAEPAELAVQVAATPARPRPAVSDPRASWCEPFDQPACSSNRDCTDGRSCVRPWWADASTTMQVCAYGMPTRSVRRWRSARARVVVDHVCRARDGCDQSELHRYLRLMILRESTWRPNKRHRLNPDLEAAASAWSKHRYRYADNPAFGDPNRWASGVGLLGQIPVIWLDKWDATAPPETLCGEVEAIEVHLRVGRAAVSKIQNGLDCDGDGARDFWGTACDDESCGPSWYDVSRINSGQLCPGADEHQGAFEARAAKVGLDPWARVDAAALGAPIPVASQDQVAAELRMSMDAIER